MDGDGDTGSTLYEAAGGEEFFRRLVDEFYAGVAGDEVLAPLYPEYTSTGEQRFAGARHRLTLFLVQYWGGPTTYADERGHPRLRMRHFPYHIGAVERDRWLIHMTQAVESVTAASIPEDDLRVEIRERLIGYFRPSAEHLRNDSGLPITSPSFRTPS